MIAWFSDFLNPPKQMSALENTNQVNAHSLHTQWPSSPHLPVYVGLLQKRCLLLFHACALHGITMTTMFMSQLLPHVLSQFMMLHYKNNTLLKISNHHEPLDWWTKLWDCLFQISLKSGIYFFLKTTVLVLLLLTTASMWYEYVFTAIFTFKLYRLYSCLLGCRGGDQCQWYYEYWKTHFIV